MKKLLSVLSLGAIMVIIGGCSDSKARYFNLSTGKTITLEKDEKTGVMIDKETREPVYIYVDTKNNDTIYGKTGEVINGHVILGEDKKYVYDGDETLKVGKDGSVDYKEGDESLKVDKDGSVEYKDGDYKVKIDENGDTKTKNGDRKVKTEDGKTKVKND